MHNLKLLEKIITWAIGSHLNLSVRSTFSLLEDGFFVVIMWPISFRLLDGQTCFLFLNAATKTYKKKEKKMLPN